MHIRLVRFFLCFVFTTVLFAQSAPPQKTPIHSLDWLIGGVWSADISKIGNGMQRIETRYSWADNGAYVRFNTHFISDKGTAKTYDGNFYWDPNKKALAMWYMDAENKIYEGPLTIEGDLYRIEFRGEDFDGKMADLKVEVSRVTNSKYHWQLLERAGDSWKQLTALDYVKSAEQKL